MTCSSTQPPSKPSSSARARYVRSPAASKLSESSWGIAIENLTPPPYGGGSVRFEYVRFPAFASRRRRYARPGQPGGYRPPPRHTQRLCARIQPAVGATGDDGL